MLKDQPRVRRALSDQPSLVLGFRRRTSFSALRSPGLSSVTTCMGEWGKGISLPHAVDMSLSSNP